MSVKPGLCPLDCPDACSLEVTVEDGRVTALDGGPGNPVTRGFICAKVRRFPEAMYGPDRVMTPLRRVGPKGEGRFEPCTWDHALDATEAEIRRVRDGFGGEAVLPLYYGGSNGYYSQGGADERFFRRLGASRLDRTVCAAPTGAAAAGLYGKMGGVAYEDYEESRLIVVWGANPHASGVHLVPFIQRAQKKGARLVVVDPRRTKLAARADFHLAPRVGTDLPLALAVANRLFETGAADAGFLREHAAEVETFRERASRWPAERAAAECGIAAGDIERFADLYAATDPAVIRCGWGLERNRNGGGAVAAVLALPAVAGKFGVPGGGYTLSNSAVWGVDGDAAAGARPPATRIVNQNRVGAVLTADDSSVRFLFVYNHNPAVTLPEQNLVLRGLEREDLFTVVFDSFLTDTALYADLVLPAATFLERRELARGYGSYRMHETPPVADPVGESRSNHDVFTELCRRLDLEAPGDPGDETGVRAALLHAHPGVLEALERDGATVPGFGDRPVQFGDVFPNTPDRRVHLVPETLDREAPGGLYAYRPESGPGEFPLALISPATDRMVSSTLGQLYDDDAFPLRLHPADAAGRGIATGDRVRVWNDRGEVATTAVLDDALRPGVAELAKGLWLRHAANRRTANALAPDTLTDIGGGACFNDARVEVARL